MAFPPREAYERLIYSLPDTYPEVQSSSQSHSEVPELASTFLHHQHEPPDIKHNRRPAQGISFTVPNLPTLIADCLELGKVCYSTE
jgi:hypothetical protein